MGLFNASVTVILISDIIFFDTGLNKALFGSKVNGNDLLKLSVGIIINVFVNTPSLILSVIRSQFMFMTSILLVIFGSLLLYSVCVIILGSKPIRSPNFELDISNLHLFPSSTTTR